MTFGLTFELVDTPNGQDLIFDDTLRLKTITGNVKVAQDLKVLFKTQKGEDMFSLNFGTNLMSLFQSNAPTQVVESVIRDALYKYQYYNTLKSLNIISTDYINRTMTIELNILVNEELVNLQLVV